MTGRASSSSHSASRSSTCTSRAGSARRVASDPGGAATENDLEMLRDVCDRIIGKCLCVLGDSAAMPVASCVTKFRDEFREHLEHGGGPVGRGSRPAHYFPAAG